MCVCVCHDEIDGEQISIGNRGVLGLRIVVDQEKCCYGMEEGVIKKDLIKTFYEMESLRDREREREKIFIRTSVGNKRPSRGLKGFLGL